MSVCQYTCPVARVMPISQVRLLQKYHRALCSGFCGFVSRRGGGEFRHQEFPVAGEPAASCAGRHHGGSAVCRRLFVVRQMGTCPAQGNFEGAATVGNVPL